LSPLSGSKVMETPLTMWTTWRDLPGPQRVRIRGYVLYLLLVAALFIRPLIGLMQHAARFELHSHIPLVPVIAGYMLYVRRGAGITTYRTSIAGMVLLGAVGVGVLIAGLWWRGSLSVNDYLALTTLSFVSIVAAGGFLFLGSGWVASAAFPLAFLIFMSPMPDGMTNAFELASMNASADVSAVFIRMTGTPMLRDGNVFALPGIVIQVAQECSGIRSSWVLFITSLVASHVLLRGSWRRMALVAFVIPLGIVRNAFRILVIGLLCVHLGPHVADSAIHHQGGPLFFVLSLGPLYLFLWWLRRGET
jgi:exosortase C (VPDSG-CTERM-specific)